MIVPWVVSGGRTSVLGGDSSRWCDFGFQMGPIQQGLKDAHPYVRRTAVMAVLKVYNIDRGAVQRTGKAPPPSHSWPNDHPKPHFCVCRLPAPHSRPHRPNHHHVSPHAHVNKSQSLIVEEGGWEGLLDDLRKLMRSDLDAQVVANCMSVLQQVLPRHPSLLCHASSHA